MVGLSIPIEKAVSPNRIKRKSPILIPSPFILGIPGSLPNDVTETEKGIGHIYGRRERGKRKKE